MKTNTIPQQVKLAPGALSQLPALLRQYGKKVLLVHGHRPVEDGLLEKVRVLLDEANFPSANMGQILPNPKYGSVKRGIEIARKEDCDIILALGGGSTLQCAKAIGLGLGYKGDVWDFWKEKKKPKHVYPIASILTNPSSASELSENCTIVRKGEQKTIHLPELVCKFAILDPELSMYPSYPTMNQIFGIFEHLFLAYLEQDPPKTKEAANLLKDLRHCSDALAKNINDVEARTELYRVGLLAHTQIGSVKSPFEGLTDRLAFACSLPAGSAGSALFAPWCDSLSKEEKERIAQLGMDMFDFPKPSYKKTIAELTKWFEKMNLPQSLEAAGVKLDKKTIAHIAKAKHQKKVLKKANQMAKSKKEPDQKKPSKPAGSEAPLSPEKPAPKEEKAKPEESKETAPVQPKPVPPTPKALVPSAPDSLPSEKPEEPSLPKEEILGQKEHPDLFVAPKKKHQNGDVNAIPPVEEPAIKKEIVVPSQDEKERSEFKKPDSKKEHHHHHHKDHHKEEDKREEEKSEKDPLPREEKEVALTSSQVSQESQKSKEEA